jgi:hypothetical protein
MVPPAWGTLVEEFRHQSRAALPGAVGKSVRTSNELRRSSENSRGRFALGSRPRPHTLASPTDSEEEPEIRRELVESLFPVAIDEAQSA